MKRAFDLFFTIPGLIVLSPLMLAIMLIIKIVSPGPVFFLHSRIGKGFRRFSAFKFRTMVVDAPKLGAAITIGEDPRITWIGRFLRKTKMDELPQLVNVVLGDMSLVGPRPEVARYVDMFHDDYEEVLRVRPGLTDLASIRFRDESGLLGTFDDPERAYIERILPRKIELAKEYVRNQSLWLDLKIIFQTLWCLLADRIPGRSTTPAVPSVPTFTQTSKGS
jgi:lipopolysaccharide/colanic/teichoic acid biosynthesis glycosyltransferase